VKKSDPFVLMLAASMSLAQARCSDDSQRKSTPSASSTATASSSSGAGGGSPDGGPSGGGTGGGGIINPIGTDAGMLACGDAGRKSWKLDLLFMIDNSSSMTDKQEILAQAVPDLVNRFLDPVCVDPKTFVQVGTRLADGSCAVGVPEFDPITDLHIAIITSSLGAHGATGICDDALDVQGGRKFPHNDDRGHLVARDTNDAVVPTFQSKGFLNWQPGGGGSGALADLIAPFQSMVRGVGQHGCGYEASLESIYRFLVDPDPYQSITIDKTVSPPVGVATLVGTDTVLLQQRADFLRPDSLVSVIALTDENDCSIVDGGQGFYAILPAEGAPPTSLLSHGTTACLTNPNDRCCINCGQPPQPGCTAPADDPECKKGAWSLAEDPVNLRCWQQSRRYGHDFLEPIQRYVNGFKSSQVPDRTGTLVKNPLFSDLKCNGVGCAPERDKALVYFAAIVGVPWQDLAVDSTDLTKGYLTAKQITDGHVWDKILGDPANPAGPVAPSDPHMIESIAPRNGLAGTNGAPRADAIHGHEWDPSQDMPANADLQYACVFDLSAPKTCTSAADCDCASPAMSKNPVCQDLATGAYSTKQTRAKAYPGIRELQVMKGLGDQAIVASICPANTTDPMRADFGYRPVIAAIVNRLRPQLRDCPIVR
jgi:hypothetical protein